MALDQLAKTSSSLGINHHQLQGSNYTSISYSIKPASTSNLKVHVNQTIVTLIFELNMHRYSPVRNQRSKGVKIKHVLRFCFLIAVCCWLIFQIKRSHYKRRDLESVDTETLSSTDSVDEVIKLGRKDLQPKVTETHEEEEEEEDDEEHDIEEEKDDEIDENEQYKFDDEDNTVNESDEKDAQSQSQTAREEHYKADDASSAVTNEHDNLILDNSTFLETSNSEHENHVHNETKIQETGYELANISSDNGQNDSDSTRVVEKPETFIKSTNMSAVVESQTTLTTKENSSGSLKTEVEIEDPDEVQHDAIDATDLIRLEDRDVFDNSEDTVSE